MSSDKITGDTEVEDEVTDLFELIMEKDPNNTTTENNSAEVINHEPTYGEKLKQWRHAQQKNNKNATSNKTWKTIPFRRCGNRVPNYQYLKQILNEEQQPSADTCTASCNTPIELLEKEASIGFDQLGDQLQLVNDIIDERQNHLNLLMGSLKLDDTKKNAKKSTDTSTTINTTDDIFNIEKQCDETKDALVKLLKECDDVVSSYEEMEESITNYDVDFYNEQMKSFKESGEDINQFIRLQQSTLLVGINEPVAVEVEEKRVEKCVENDEIPSTSKAAAQLNEQAVDFTYGFKPLESDDSDDFDAKQH